VSRAISILKGWEEDISPGTEEITEAVSRRGKKSVAKFGPDRLPAGPELSGSKEIIIVEGRADIINLMKNGISNTVAVEGTHIPKSISELTKKRGKKVIAFLDGDRGGDLILRELMQVARIDYIARAPGGKEVEDLTKREITKALQAKIPAEKALALVSDKRSTTRGRKKQPRREEPREEVEPRRAPPRGRAVSRRRVIEIDEAYKEKIREIKESFKAILFDSDKKVIVECGVAELAKTLEQQESVEAIVFDGVVTQRLVDTAITKKTSLLVGAAIADLEERPRGMQIVTFEDLPS
jgi:DNA primase